METWNPPPPQKKQAVRKIFIGIEASVRRKPGTAHHLCNIISML